MCRSQLETGNLTAKNTVLSRKSRKKIPSVAAHDGAVFVATALFCDTVEQEQNTEDDMTDKPAIALQIDDSVMRDALMWCIPAHIACEIADADGPYDAVLTDRTAHGEGTEDTDTSAVPVVRVQYPFRLGRILQKLERLFADDAQDTIAIGPYLFKPFQMMITHEGEAIRLTEKERDILMRLYREKGGYVTRQALLDDVWQYADTVETHTLETHIYRLRQKVEKDPANPALVMTDDDGYYLGFYDEP